MTKPTIDPGEDNIREFYDARPRFETFPQDDPPMTVRCESWEDRYDPEARRVVKIVRLDGGRTWVGASGKGTALFWRDQDVADWPVVPPLSYCAAFRHEQTRAELEQALRSELTGDMGEEAFRGGPR